MTTALISHPDCLSHHNPDGHPERVDRLRAIEAVLAPVAGLDRVEAPLGTDDHVRLAHPADYLAKIVAASPEAGFVTLDGDTNMSPGSLRAAFRAVGGIIEAVDRVIEGRASNAFVATRPPGHHAETRTPMGFCLFGNVVIGARHALIHHGLSRVAIVD
ncbi:MAG: histone deacetylase family protein, partial [Pseudomonadota bacterium]